MDFNAVPWTTEEVITFVCLIVGTIMVTAFPVVYGIRAQLRDQLARIIVLATALTAAAFLSAVVFTLLHHANAEPGLTLRHWLARLIYISVGLGKVAMLWALIRTPPLPDGDRAEPGA